MKEVEWYLSKSKKEQIQRNKPSKKQKKEKLSFKDWEEIMGKNRPTYGRNSHGAISNKRI